MSFQARLQCEGEVIPLSSPFSIGRNSKCSYTTTDAKVSWVHALFQFNQAELHWLLSDVDSTNGTYLNGTRISKPEILNTGDQVQVGDLCLFFEQDAIEEAPTASANPGHTALVVESIPCWLLVADIKGSSRLSQELPQRELSARIRTWADECDTLIRRYRGMVNEFMGDGLLAFWRATPETDARIAELLGELSALESQSGLPFRVVMHHGTVEFGGGTSSGVEKLAGMELNFVFKTEKVAADFGSKISLTQAAYDLLNNHLTCRKLGDFELPGFAGSHQLFAPEF